MHTQNRWYPRKTVFKDFLKSGESTVLLIEEIEFGVKYLTEFFQGFTETIKQRRPSPREDLKMSSILKALFFEYNLFLRLSCRQNRCLN